MPLAVQSFGDDIAVWRRAGYGTLNLAGYWTVVKEHQANVVSSLETAAIRSYPSNIPEVRVRGVEADFAAARSSRPVCPSKEIRMKISVRNVLPGTIRHIEMGAVNAQLTIEIAPDVTIASIVTAESVKNLSLAVGKSAYAVIKASSVMVAVD